MTNYEAIQIEPGFYDRPLKNPTDRAGDKRKTQVKYNYVPNEKLGTPGHSVGEAEVARLMKLWGRV